MLSVANSQKVQQKGLLFPLSVASADGKLQQKDSISKAFCFEFSKSATEEAAISTFCCKC